MAKKSYTFESTDSIVHSLLRLSAEPTIRVESFYSERIDVSRLQTAIDSVMNYEPILKTSLDSDVDGVMFKALPDSYEVIVREFDNEDQYAKYRSEAVKVSEGPLLEVSVFHADNGDYFLIKLAHEASDGFGMLRLYKYISETYNGDMEEYNRPVEWAPSSRSPRRLFSQYGVATYIKLLLLSIREKMLYFFPKGTMYFGGSRGGKNETHMDDFTIDNKDFDEIREISRKHGGTVNDFMLTAFARTIARLSGYNGDKAIRLLYTVDLRRYIPSTEVASSEICNLSVFECVNIGKGLDKDFEETLSRTVVATCKKKAVGVGMGSVYDLASHNKKSHRQIENIARMIKKFVDSSQSYPMSLTNCGVIEEAGVRLGVAPEWVKVYAPTSYYPDWCFAMCSYRNSVHITSSCNLGRSGDLRRILNGVIEEISSQLPHR